MSALAAARLGDEVAHGFGLAAMIGGAVVGALVGAAIVAATVATGGAAAVIIAGAVAAGGLSTYQLVKGISTVFNLPEPTTGVLAGGSPNVFVNSRPAMRASIDFAASCTGLPMNHPFLPTPILIAEGSGSVFINGLPAARLQSKLVCGAHIKSASPNVNWGGPTVRTNSVFDLEEWVHTGLEYLGMAALAGAGILALAAGAAATGIFIGVTGLCYGGFEALGYIGDRLGPGYKDILQGAAGLALLFAGPKLAKRNVPPEEIAGRKASERPLNERTCVNDPVDVVTGEVVLQQTDFSLPGTLPLTFSRTHISGYTHGTFMGPNWACTWGQWLEVENDTLTFHAEDAASYHFDLPAPGQTVTHRLRKTLSLTHTPAGYVLQWRHGPQLCFQLHAAGKARLIAIVERNGHRIDLNYNPSGALSEVLHSSGTILRVEGNARAITRVVLCQNDGTETELIRYAYDPKGRLSQIINSSNLPLKFEYDTAGRLTRWEDRRGHWFAYFYDERGRCVRTQGATEHMNGRFSYHEADRCTIYTNSCQQITSYTYNEHFQVIRCEDARGGITETEYDDYQRKIRETAPDFSTTQWAYDDRGNLIAVTNALGQVTTIAYNAHDLPVTLASPAGEVWHRDYDPAGNVLAVRNPDGQWCYERDAQGNVIRVHNPAGHTAEFAYDSRGLLRESSDWRANRTRFERDAFGRVATRIDAQGNRTRYRYTIEGLLGAVELPDGRVKRARYDGEGNLVQSIDPLGRVTQFEYGPFDRLTAKTAPNGGTTRYEYDSELQLARVTNPLGEHWAYRYNATGDLVEETDFSGRARRYEVDACGRLATRINALGEVTQFRRDLLGRLIEKIAPEGATRFEYDIAGRLTRAVSPGAKLVFEYDAQGRLVRETQNGQAIAYAYDALGRRIRRETAAGHESTWTFDANGLPLSLTLPDAQAFRFLHDSLGRETLRTLPGELRQEKHYDSLGRLTRQRTTTALRDRHAPTLIQERQLAYGAHGLPERIEDSAWGATDYRFDEAGQVTDAQRAHEHERYAYDLAGNLLQAIQFNARYDEPEADTHGSRAYQQARLTRAGRVQYEHDAEGRVITRIEGRRWGTQRVWRYRWTSDNRLHRLHTPDGQCWEYSYDLIGRRLSKRQVREDAQPWRETRYLWDGNTLAEETLLLHTPKADGTTDTRIEKTTHWDFETGSFRPLAKTEVIHQNGKQKRYTYAVLTDQIGTPRELVTEKGEIAWQARTDLWGNVKEITRQKTDCPIRFQGQYYDEESKLAYNHQRYYDAQTGRYLTPDPLGLEGGPNPYAYVSNPLEWVDPLGLMACTKAYNTQAEAAKAALDEANPLSIKDNLEYGGLIYKDSAGKFGYSGPIRGTVDGVDPYGAPIPSKTTQVGDYHTHGDYSVVDSGGNVVRTSNPLKDDFNSDMFSATDKRGISADGAGNSDYRGYLGTPSGTYRVYDPSTRSDTVF